MLSTAVLLLVATCSTPLPQSPDTSLFAEPFQLIVQGSPLEAEQGYPAPLPVDFDGDGLFDLLLGQRSPRGGELLIFFNQGTPEQPVFSESSLFEAAGAPVRIPVG